MNGPDPRVPAEFESLLTRVAALMQQGHWDEAASTLDAIEARFHGSADVAGMREMLSLHLSTEESWEESAAKIPPWVESSAVRLLLAANVLLYVLIGSLLLLVELSQAIR